MRQSWKENDGRSETREVNSLLHTLRGEQFRHSQNLLRSKAHLTAVAAHRYNDPTLPFADIYKFDHTSTDGEGNAAPLPLPVIYDGHLQHGYPRGPVPGPPIPKSWSGLFRQGDLARDQKPIAFRREALSLVFSHSPWSIGSCNVPAISEAGGDTDPHTSSTVPPLAQTCLSVLLAVFPETAEFRDELLPILPPCFRRDVLRYTAVHDPLSSAKLYALCIPEGHVDGELIVVGPQATLQRDVLVSLSPTLGAYRTGHRSADGQGEGPSRYPGARQQPHDRTLAANANAEGEEEEEGDSWEAESSSSPSLPPPLHTLVVLSATVTSAALLVFPPTLTHLALLALPARTPVHRLPRLCPLVKVLDLSYNPWLNDSLGGMAYAGSALERIDWEKWADLRILGLRACNTPEHVVLRVNKGRWDEVEVIGVGKWPIHSNMRFGAGMSKSLGLSA